MRRIWNRLFDFTGFRGKTLWDLLGLLIVPVVIALAGWYLSEVSRQNQQKIEDQRAEAQQQIEIDRAKAQQEIETDRAQQTILQSYMQDMTTLLLDKGLARSEPGDPNYLQLRRIARSSTISAVRQLDGKRKGILLGFLYESNLISHSDYQFPGSNYKSPNNPIIALSGADLSGADLSLGALNGTDLTLVNLSGADLSYSNVGSAVLNGADLTGSTLKDTHLRNTDLSGANLSGADLRDTNLSGVDLRDAEMGWFWGGANLSGANLRDAEGWTNEQLAEAESLVGATLPNGRVIETEEAWEEFKKQYRTEG
jgi:uncharacterized protein YjbI with pentapeptide repeats